MINNYNTYIIENITLDDSTIIDILKSLKKVNDTELINKIINKKGVNDRSILMSVVETNDEKLVDYILHFKVDINYKNKNGENVLFYCKNAKMVNKLIDAGADVKAKNENINRNLLIHLASKKIFNIELYKRIMNKGVDIHSMDKQKQTVLCNSISNKSMLQFLLDNKVDLNREDKYTCLYYLFYLGEFYASKTKFFFNTLKLLLENGMKIDDNFLDKLISNFEPIKSERDILDLFEVITPIKKYFSEDNIVKLWKKLHNNYYILDITKKLIRIFESPTLYDESKKYWRSSNFEEKFADIIQEFPYFDAANKYNL